MTPVSFATPRRTIVAFGGGGIVALALGVGQPPAGRLLLGVATGALLIEALRGAMLRPTVAADEHGVAVIRGIARTEVPWRDVVRIGLLDEDADRRRGPRRRASALEIDTVDRLLVVPAYRLDAPVDEVVSALRQRWQAGPAGSSATGRP